MSKAEILDVLPTLRLDERQEYSTDFVICRKPNCGPFIRNGLMRL